MGSGESTVHDASDVTTDPAQKKKARGHLIVPRGSSIGRYTILETVGAGATGTVHAAYDPELDRKVALKVIRRSHRRSRREAHALARLAHPNVITIYDVGEHEGRLFLAMEFADAGTVADWCAAPRPWPEVVELFRKAGRGLEAVHLAGLVHRDFKPANVLLFKRGDVRVSDFGLARALDADTQEDPEDEPDEGEVPAVTALNETLPASSASSRSSPGSSLRDRLTRPGDLLGTPLYMAPEQHRGEAASEASDQFSFAVALYECLYGKPPYAGDTRGEVLAAMQKGQPAFPPKPATPGWLRRALSRGLAYDPAARFPTMTAFLAALDPGRGRASLVVGALALVGAGLAAAALVGGRGADEPCAKGSLAGLWDEARRGQVRAGLLATGAPYAPAAAQAVTQRLDAWASELEATELEVCTATRVRRVQSEAQMGAQEACLRERRRELATLLDIFAEADAKIASRAASAVQGVGRPRRCLEVAADAPPTQPVLAAWSRDGLARGRALMLAGRIPDAIATVRAATVAGAAAGEPRTALRGLLQLGQLVMRIDLKKSEPVLEDAVWRGIAGGYDREAAEAAMSLVGICNRQQRTADGTRWAAQAEALLSRDPDELARAELLSLRASTLRHDGRSAEALPLVRESLAIRERLLPPGDLALALSHHDLGNLHYGASRFPEAIAEYRIALGIRERVLGPRHPTVASTYSNLGASAYGLGNYGEAVAQHEKALAIYRETLPAGSNDLAVPLYNLGGALAALERFDEALVVYQESREIYAANVGPESSDVADIIADVADVRAAQKRFPEAMTGYAEAIAMYEKLADDGILGAAGIKLRRAKTEIVMRRFAEALSDAQAAQAALEKAYGAEHIDLAAALRYQGEAYLGQGNARAARPPLERALAIRAKMAGAPGDLAATRWAYARTLWALGEKERALSEGDQAVAEAPMGKGRDEIAAWRAAVR